MQEILKTDSSILNNTALMAKYTLFLDGTIFSIWGICTISLFFYFSGNNVKLNNVKLSFHLSTGERPFVDLIQDRRFWLIHAITIPTLFLSGTILVASGFVYKLFG